MYARLNSAGAFTEFKDALTANPRLSVKVLRQSEYYAEQSERAAPQQGQPWPRVSRQLIHVGILA